MKNIILMISVICLICILDSRVAEAVGPGKGEMTKNGVYVGNNCTVDSLTVKWNLDSIIGEPLVKGTYKYTGDCKPDPSFMVWLRVEHSGTWGHVRIAPAIPDKPGVWGFNAPGSPAWNRLLCAHEGTRTLDCVSKEAAKSAWKNGRVTDFQVPWSGSGSGSFRGRAASPGPLALDRKKKILIQRGLASLGFDAGPADGMFGPKTRAAIRSWQKAKGYDASGQTGRLTSEQADALAMLGEGTLGRQAKRERVARKARERAEAERKERKRKTKQAREKEKASFKSFGPNWIIVKNQRCQIYNPFPKLGETATWTGACVDGKGSGKGRTVWRGEYGEQVYDGALRNGKMHGWATIYQDGNRYEGEYRNGKRQGRWTIRYSNGGSAEGPYVDGKKHGRWTDRYSSGSGGSADTHYVDGKKHGLWIRRLKDGSRLEAEYSNGSREGRPGVYVTSKGKRYRGTWSEGCFIDRKGRTRIKSSEQTWEECRRISRRRRR